jgi:hypothetical protein
MRSFPLIQGAVLAAVLAATAAAQAPASAPRDYAVRCGRLLIGDGTTALEDAWLVVRQGKIASIGKDAPPSDLTVIDCRQRVVMPGIVAVDSDLSGARDDEYAVTPDFMAVDGFDFESTQRDALAGGVTTVYLSPGRERLVSGQGGVIKTHGMDIVQRVLADSTSLRVNFGDGGVSAPRVFEPTAHPTDDDPLLPARIQTPTARIGVLPELRALFREAVRDTGLSDENKGENRFDMAALKATVERKLPVRAAATKAADIRRALLLQQEFGIRMVLENPQEIATIAAQAASQQVTATFRMPVLLGRANPGTEDRLVELPELRFDEDRPSAGPVDADARLPHRRGSRGPLGPARSDGAARDWPGRRRDPRRGAAHRHARARQGRGLHRPQRRSVCDRHDGRSDLRRWPTGLRAEDREQAARDSLRQDPRRRRTHAAQRRAFGARQSHQGARRRPDDPLRRSRDRPAKRRDDARLHRHLEQPRSCWRRHGRACGLAQPEARPSDLV